MRDATEEETAQLKELLVKYEIEALIAKHKPQGLEVRFDTVWLDFNALAASLPRSGTSGPYSIALSPKLLEWSFTDRIAFSTIILHELAHVIDRFKNWGKYVSNNPVDQPEALEYEADGCVIEWGWKDELVETLRRTTSRYRALGMPEGMIDKRLSRISGEA